MQKLIIAGNVGKDAVLRRTQSGDPVLGFSVAVNNGKDKEGKERPATWFDCAIWGKRAESLERHITKGTKLTLEGRPTCREHDGKAYLGISVNELTFMGGGSRSEGEGGGSRSEGEGGGYMADQSGGDAPAGGYGGGDLDDSEIPF